MSIGSVPAQSPEPGHFAPHGYAAAEGAVEALTRSMAAPYAARGIRVNVIAAGMVRTPAAARSNAELPSYVEQKQPPSK